MSKKGGKSTPKQLDKTENRVTPTNEFIPGIPDTEWDLLNEVDQRDCFISDLVDDLVSNSLDLVTKRWVEKSASICAVDQVCSILNSTFDLFFISHDKGNPNLGKEWEEDKPPNPSIIDSWTNGKVPVVRTPPERPDSRMTASTSSTMMTIESSQISTGKEKSFLGPSAGPVKQSQKIIPQNQNKSQNKDKNKLKPFKRYTGRLKSAKLKNLTTPLDKSEEELLKSQLKNHQKEKLGEKTKGLPKNFATTLKATQKAKSFVEYDEFGNVLKVDPICPSELPPLHRSKPEITVGDGTPKQNDKKWKNKKTTQNTTNKNVEFSKRLSGRIIDNIDLQSGVTLREGDLVRSGPKKGLGGLNGSPRVVDLAPIRVVQSHKISPTDIVK